MQHYDPTYRHGLQRNFHRIRTWMELPNLSEASLKEAAQQLLSDSCLAHS